MRKNDQYFFHESYNKANRTRSPSTMPAPRAFTLIHAMVCLLNNMWDITAYRKLTAAKRLNSIYGLQIQFNYLKKDTGMLNGAIPPQVAFEAPQAARPVQPKILADKGIEREIAPEKKEEQYENILEENDKSDQANALSRQMATVIWWNGPGLY